MRWNRMNETVVAVCLPERAQQDDTGRHSLTAECCSASEAAAHIHGGDGVPDAILVRRVVQALHGAEPRAPVVASDHVNSIV